MTKRKFKGKLTTQLENNELLNRTEERAKGNDTDMTYEYFQLLASLASKSEVIRIAGDPSKVSYESEEEVLHYPQYSVFLHHNNAAVDYISVHTDVLILHKRLQLGLDKATGLSILEKFHLNMKLQYNAKIEQADDEEFYYLTDSGISIWFDDGIISDICIDSINDN